MKKISLFLCAGVWTVFAGEPLLNWQNAWKSVHDKLHAGEIGKAREEILSLESRAVRDQIWDQVVRATVERFKVERKGGMETWERALEVLGKFAQEAPGPISSLLEVYLAHFYWEFFLTDSSRSFDRPRWPAEADREGRPSKWSSPRLIREIDLHFRAALDDSSRLKGIRSEPWRGVLKSESLDARYYPTLFDLLAHDWIGFCEWKARHDGERGEALFGQGEASSAFSDVEHFMRLTPGPAAPHLAEAVRMYQALLAFHEGDRERSAYGAADLARLSFCFRHIGGTSSRERYIGALDQFISNWRKWPVSAYASSLRATLSWEDGEPGIAHLIASRGITGFHGDEVGVRGCRTLIDRILEPSLTLELESVWMPSRTQIRVSYRNIPELYFRLLSLPGQEFLALPEGRGRADRVYLDLKPSFAWSVPLPPCRDYKSRTYTLFPPDGIPKGQYLLLVSNSPDFSEGKSLICSQGVQISDLAVVLAKRGGRVVGGTAFDARSGRPLSGAMAQIWQKRVGGADPASSPSFVRMRSVVSDPSGQFSLEGEGRGVALRFCYGGDTLWAPGRWDQGRSEGTGERRSALLWTDSPLYRPGERIRYAGIALSFDPEEALPRLAPAGPISLRLSRRGAPPVETVASVEEGSALFSGGFSLPKGLSPGPVQLTAGESSPVDLFVSGQGVHSGISLGRPDAASWIRGEVTLPVRLTLPGKITPDTPLFLSWRVVRKPPEREGSRPLGGALVAEGAIPVSERGTFPLSFSLDPSREGEKDALPSTYTASVRLKDSRGAIHTAARSFKWGRTSWLAGIECGEWQQADRPVKFKVSSLTLAGDPLSVTGTLRIQKLRGPERVSRSWTGGGWKERTRSWKEDEVLASEVITTGTNGWAKGAVSLPAGLYRLYFESLDNLSKRVVRVSETLLVQDPKSDSFPLSLPEVVIPERRRVHPGEILRIFWGTGYEGGQVRIEILKGGRVLQVLRNGEGRTQQQFELPITAQMRGGVTLRTLLVRENRAYLTRQVIRIPWTGDTLKARWEKTAPAFSPGKGVELRVAFSPAKGKILKPTHWVGWLEAPAPEGNGRFSREGPPVFRDEDGDSGSSLFLNALIVSPPWRRPQAGRAAEVRWKSPSWVGVLPFTSSVRRDPRTGESGEEIDPPLALPPRAWAGALTVGERGASPGSVIFRFTPPPDRERLLFKVLGYDGDLNACYLETELRREGSRKSHAKTRE